MVRRQRRTVIQAPFVSGLVLAGLLLAGCGSPVVPPATSGAAPAPDATTGAPSPGKTESGNTESGTAEGTQGTPPSDAATGTAPGTTTPATSPAAGAPPSSSGWKTFTTSDGTLSFDYPATWVIRDPAGEAPLGGEFVDVVNAAGKQMAALRTNIVTGAECGDQQPYLLIDSEPMQALTEPGVADQTVPRFVFEGRGDATAKDASPPTIASYGITMMPEETGPLSCPMFQLFLWPPSGALFGQAYDPAKNTTPGDPGLPYLEKAKLYATTAEYQDVRKMITSLRPAKGAVTGTVTEPAN
ncbi:hypothetical protein [Arthrobacter sp. ES3-54]|uniref:hypothetical protein n=1 Tax=Arthrobacter sp. ES3-54 TaxID=1502991 RepID=UPI002405B280|nr:hypothetical protein [Arthrobacter sp. ES3-54]MDF9751630.1 hypothetical protein [Arthrobacter sp. ES3-54]